MAGVVGGVVGGVIGWFVGGPTGAQWGYAIGASIGSSFEVTKMPRIGEFAQVTAGEGGPRPRVYGRVRPLGGQTVWAGRPREIRKRERSKGGAPVESSEIRRSYAIGFCEGPITRFLRIWRNNELVYDARPNPTIPWVESQKWAEKVRFYTGALDQMPCPVLQAELGGDAPAMRGTAYFSVEDDELTQSGGAVPMYAAEVQRGAAKSYTTPPYPVLVDDAVTFRVIPTGGELRTIMRETDLEDAASFHVAPVGGELYDIFRGTQAEDAATFSVVPIGGELKTVFQEAQASDAATFAVTPTGGELRLISLSTYLNDAATFTVTPTGGSLHDP